MMKPNLQSSSSRAVRAYKQTEVIIQSKLSHDQVIKGPPPVATSTKLDIFQYFSTFLDISQRVACLRVMVEVTDGNQPKTAPPSPNHLKHLHPAGNTSKQLHPAPNTSKHLHPAQNTSKNHHKTDHQKFSKLNISRHFSTFSTDHQKFSTFLDISPLFSTDHQKFSKLDISWHFSTLLDASQTYEKCRSRYWGDLHTGHVFYILRIRLSFTPPATSPDISGRWKGIHIRFFCSPLLSAWFVHFHGWWRFHFSW